MTALICLGWLAFVVFVAACWYGIRGSETRPNPAPGQQEDNAARVTYWRPM